MNRIEIVTGNMEMDAIRFLDRFALEYPDLEDKMVSRLKKWGGNSAGRKLLNIDAKGEVKPDPFFPFSIGNILQEDFSDIWQNHELLGKLRATRRKLSGKCENCEYLDYATVEAEAEPTQYMVIYGQKIQAVI